MPTPSHLATLVTDALTRLSQDLRAATPPSGATTPPSTLTPAAIASTLATSRREAAEALRQLHAAARAIPQPEGTPARNRWATLLDRARWLESAHPPDAHAVATWAAEYDALAQRPSLEEATPSALATDAAWMARSSKDQPSEAAPAKVQPIALTVTARHVRTPDGWVEAAPSGEAREQAPRPGPEALTWADPRVE